MTTKHHKGDIQIAKRKEVTDGPDRLYDVGLTLIHPFHGEDQRFELHWNHWVHLPEILRNKLKIIVVDDHGTPSIESLITDEKKEQINFDFSLYRITDDLKWSTPAALNLGLMSADTPWTLIMDSDCLFEAEEFAKVFALKPWQEIGYKFERKRITTDPHLAKTTRYLPCTILQHKDIFLAVNGFDEDFIGTNSGGYGFFDNHYDSKVYDAGFRQRYLTEPIVTEYMQDQVGLKVQRRTQDMDTNRRLMYQKWNDEVPNNMKILNFNWKRII